MSSVCARAHRSTLDNSSEQHQTGAENFHSQFILSNYVIERPNQDLHNANADVKNERQRRQQDKAPPRQVDGLIFILDLEEYELDDVAKHPEQRKREHKLARVARRRLDDGEHDVRDRRADHEYNATHFSFQHSLNYHDARADCNRDGHELRTAANSPDATISSASRI
jgi:hypothetical protein